MRYFYLGIIFFVAACVEQQPQKVVVEAPASESTVPKDDSSYLSVSVLDSTIEVKVHDKAAIVKDTAGLNEFIVANHSLIDENRITIYTARNMRIDLFKPVIEVMKRNGYLKFRMDTK